MPLQTLKKRVSAAQERSNLSNCLYIVHYQAFVQLGFEAETKMTHYREKSNDAKAN